MSLTFVWFCSSLLPAKLKEIFSLLKLKDKKWRMKEIAPQNWVLKWSLGKLELRIANIYLTVLFAPDTLTCVSKRECTRCFVENMHQKLLSRSWYIQEGFKLMLVKSMVPLDIIVNLISQNRIVLLRSHWHRFVQP